MGKLKQISVSFFLIMLMIIQVKAQGNDKSQLRYNSLLWEITGNNLTKPSYLYGTMHVSKKVAFHLTDTFFIALNKVNAIALEEDPGTWMEEMFNSKFFSERSEAMLKHMYGNFYKSAFKIELPKNVHISQTFSFQPDFINGLMYRFNSREGNFEENTYLDLFIYQSARKIGKPVIGLETFAEGQNYFLLASRPDKDTPPQDDYHYPRKNLTKELENAYRIGDLDLLDSISRLTFRSRNRQKYLIDERNKVFVEKMDSVMQSGTTLFTGMGAAHLPGELGVINMLRTKGYNVRAVSYNQSSKADKEKLRIENTFGPVTYTPHYFSDSSVSLMSPGKLYKIIGGSNSLFICPDMTNGSYYSILLMNRFEAFTGQTIDYTVKRIDSLLYESIPGKILSKKYKTTPEGYPAIEITNRTRRGDVARSKIIVSPEYIYFFNMSGTGDYVLDGQHDKYFNSISIANISKNYDWRKIYGEGYSFDMPGEVYKDVSGDDKVKMNDAFVHSFNKKDASSYIFLRSNYPDFYYLEEDSFELSQLVDEFADQLEFVVEDKKYFHEDIGVGGRHPVLTATMKNDSTKYFMKVIIDGPHYSLLCCKPGKNDEHERFLSSFKLEQTNYPAPFEELKDTSLHFKVLTFPEDDKSLAIGNEEIYRGMGLDDDEFDYGNDKSRNRTFSSPLTNECIKVTYRKFNIFYQAKSKKDFWDNQLDDIDSDTTMVLTSKKVFQKDSLDVMTFTMTDTACTRGIYYKMILKNDALYTLCATIDTLVPRSKWLTTFYDSFTPYDTAKSVSVFDSKTDKFFEYLYSNDTLKNKIVRKNFWRAKLDSTAVPKLIAWTKDTMASKYSSSFMENMISRIGTLKHPQSVPFLKDLYVKSEDSTHIQLAILDALADRETIDGTMAFKELITNDAPLSSDESDIESVFEYYYDTLELATNLFPELLKLSTYPEYKVEVYRLLAATKANKKIKSVAYKGYLSNILHDANDELKRELNSGDKVFDDNENDYRDYQNSRSYKAIIRAAMSESSDYEDYDYGFKSAGLYEHNSTIEDFAILLLDFYKTEVGVRNFITKLQKSKDKEMVMRAQVLMLKDSIEVPDSTWKSYTATKENRVKLYRELSSINRLDKFDTTHMNQLDITESLLFSTLTDKDTIQFMEKRYLKTRYEEGYVYFYKYKKESSTTWKIGYNYLQPTDSSKIDVKTNWDYVEIKEMSKLPKQIDKICKELALIGRERAGSGYGNEYDDYGDDY